MEIPKTLVIEMPTPFAREVLSYMLEKRSEPMVTLPGWLGQRGDLRRHRWYLAHVSLAPKVSGAEQDGLPTVRADLRPLHAKLDCDAACEVQIALLKAAHKEREEQ
jgi:hypothetical protein